MSNQRGFIQVLMILALLLIGFGGGVYLVQRQTNLNSLAKVNTPIAALSPSPLSTPETSTSAQPSVIPSPSVSLGKIASNPATPTPPDCGSVNSPPVWGDPTHNSYYVGDGLDAGALPCFANAYKNCTPANLIFTQNNLDTGTKHSFQTQQSNGLCIIQDQMTPTGLTYQTGISGSTRVCQKLSQPNLNQGNNTLLFSSCSDNEDILIIPSTPPN